MAFNKLFGKEVIEEAGLTGKPMKERAGAIKQGWDNLKPAQSKAIDKFVKDDEKRLAKQLKQFEKEGFYTTDDGGRSDMLPIKDDFAPKPIITEARAFR